MWLVNHVMPHHLVRLRSDPVYVCVRQGVLVGSEDSVLGYLQTPALTPLTLEWVVVQHNMMTNFLHDLNSQQLHQTDLTQTKTDRQTAAGKWTHLLQHGMRAYSAQASAATYTRNGDTLGDATDVNSTVFNPWFYIEEAFLSEPMRNPQLVVHMGGQVDLSRAFSDMEMVALIQRLGGDGGKNGSQANNGTSIQALTEEVRHRIQEVYRLTWGIPPLRQMLGYASNLMLLNDESDLFFSTERLKHVVNRCKTDSSKSEQLRCVSETVIANAANALRVIAYEFWQRYQNQLWVDVNERDIVLNAVKNSTKFAFSSTNGICRMVFMNLSQEVHDLRASQPVIAPSGSKSPKKKHASHSSAAAVKEASLVDAKDEPAPLNLFTNAIWKTLEDALLSSTMTNAAGSSTAPASSVSLQQLVVVIPADFVEWSKKYPQLRPDMVRVFEKCFAWKLENRKHRNVTIICSSDRDEGDGNGGGGSSLSFDVTDEKLGEKLTLSSVGSISDPREIVRSEKPHKNTSVPTSSNTASVTKKKPAVSQGKSGAPLVKGFFSKRYTYQSTLSLAPTSAKQPKVKSPDPDAALAGTAPSRTTESSSSVLVASTISSLNLAKVASVAAANQEHHQQRQATTSRTFASFQFLSDYRSGFLNESLHYFPPKASPKATLGPVLGRMSLIEVTAEDPNDPPLVTATVRILLEINANARVACVVMDSLANEELRVVCEMTRDVPHVFCIEGLRLERRYVYRFEVRIQQKRRRTYLTERKRSCV